MKAQTFYAIRCCSPDGQQKHKMIFQVLHMNPSTYNTHHHHHRQNGEATKKKKNSMTQYRAEKTICAHQHIQCRFIIIITELRRRVLSVNDYSLRFMCVKRTNKNIYKKKPTDLCIDLLKIFLYYISQKENE